jgi:rubrerythrin
MTDSDLRRSLLSIIKVLEKGIAMERNAREFYLEAAGKVKSDKAKEMLQWLADFEIGHEARLTAKRRELVTHPVVYGTPHAPLEDYQLSETSGGRVIPREATEIDILKIAIENEKRAYAFFQKKITLVDDPTLESTFKEMAREEERHIAILKDQLEHLKSERLWKDMREYDDFTRPR